MRCTLTGGFTLIELLVVIAIVTVMITLFMPSVKNARDAALRAVCLTNERSTFMAMMTYTRDNDGWFIPVFYNRDNAFTQPRPSNPAAWQQFGDQYNNWISDKSALVCPAANPIFATAGYGITWRTAWLLIAGTGDYEDNKQNSFFGRKLNVVRDPITAASLDSAPFTKNGITQGPVPNVRWLGRSKTDPYNGLTVSFYRPSKHGAMAEVHHSQYYNFWWADNLYSVNTYLALLHHDNGGNVLFMDGHGSYRLSLESSPHFQSSVIFQSAFW